MFIDNTKSILILGPDDDQEDQGGGWKESEADHLSGGRAQLLEQGLCHQQHHLTLVS